MSSDGMRQLRYLLESHVPWKPERLVVQPWEVGLLQIDAKAAVLNETTTKINMAMNHDKTHDRRRIPKTRK